MNIAGAEEDLKTAAKVERFDAVLVQLQRLVVDGADEVAAAGGALIENRTDRGNFSGLSEHEGGELLARKFSRPVEQRPFEVIVQRKLAGIERGKGKFVAVLKVLPVEVKGFGGLLAGIAVPAVGQNDAADVPEKSGDASHERSSLAFPAEHCRAILLDSSNPDGIGAESQKTVGTGAGKRKPVRRFPRTAVR